MMLFDLDGTLIDSNDLWQEVDRIFLAAHNLTSTQEYLDTIGHSIFPIAAQFTKDYYNLELSTQQIMDEWLALAKDAYEHQIPLKAGAREYLMQAIAKGTSLALVSACVPELGHAVLNRHGLTALFDQIIFAQEFGLEKRDPDFFKQVLKILDVAAQECIFFDDAPDNCVAGKAAGMKVIGILDPLYASDAGRMASICDHCITDFTELLD